MNKNWSCPKCSCNTYQVDEFNATGGGLEKLFDIQSKKFTTVTCTKCKFTELYKASSSDLENIMDWFIG
ncbi:zinc ribbon domain-containing protein [[Clostridium] dakarense]|uniref:zinc ribbon domain-containing protein n=1 Tax=Faecalimicrobium dakarense TaxID=1301100 RepID=UPI0004B57DBC|nr:zinc ribbon domain-containing protein [[Clostridium] dakarense]